MIKAKTLRSLSAGDQIAVATSTNNMKLVESLKANGYGNFKQKKVLLVDPKNCSTWNAIFIECLEPSPPLKKKGRSSKIRPLPPDLMRQYCDMLLSLTVDFKMGKVEVTHYLNLLLDAAKKMRGDKP